MSSIYASEDYRGVSWVPLSAAVGGPNVLKAAEAGKRHRIIGGMLSFPVAGTLDLLSGVTSLFGGAMSFDATGGFAVHGTETWHQTEVGEALNMTTTGGAPRGFLKIVTEAG